MKPKKWLIPVCAIAGVLLLCAAIYWYTAAHMLSFSAGRFLTMDNGAYMMVVDQYGPIRLSAAGGRDGVFDGLENGDKVLVLHSLILETYPAQTRIYGIFKLSGGTINDIPEDTLKSLADLDWQPKES